MITMMLNSALTETQLPVPPLSNPVLHDPDPLHPISICKS